MEDKIFDQEFFKKLNNINLNIKLRLSQGAQGGRKSQAKGVSVEFSDFREYVPGDDFRRIDWNAYGRFDKLFIKLFMEEREGLFNFFIDGSKSMDFGENKKSYTALKLTAALSYVMLNNLDRVYINTLKAEEIETSKGLAGKMIFQKLLKDLSSISFDGNTDLNKAIKKRNIKGRGISIIISDFFNLEEIEEAVKYLSYKKQQVILIQVLSKEELRPELEGNLSLIDSESGEEVRVTLTPSILKDYERELSSFKKSLEEIALRYGGQYVQISSEDSLEKILFSDLTSKGLIFKG